MCMDCTKTYEVQCQTCSSERKHFSLVSWSSDVHSSSVSLLQLYKNIHVISIKLFSLQSSKVPSCDPRWCSYRGLCQFLCCKNSSNSRPRCLNLHRALPESFQTFNIDSCSQNVKNTDNVQVLWVFRSSMCSLENYGLFLNLLCNNSFS